MHRFIPVLGAQQGWKVAEIPVNHRPRVHGRTKFGLERYARGMLDLLAVVFMGRYGNRPLHLFGGIGIFFFLIGLLIGIYLTIEKISGESIGDRPLLLLGVLLIVVGIQFFTFGLLAQMLVAMRHERRQRIAGAVTSHRGRGWPPRSPASAARGWPRGCSRASRLAAAALLLWLNRGTSFYSDELAWFADLSGRNDLDSILTPHNSHLIGTTRLVYLPVIDASRTRLPRHAGARRRQRAARGDALLRLGEATDRPRLGASAGGPLDLLRLRLAARRRPDRVHGHVQHRARARRP